jgi:hypothetical protein
MMVMVRSDADDDSRGRCRRGAYCGKRAHSEQGGKRRSKYSSHAFPLQMVTSLT